jgi:prepilin-type N-terminal cleavage/methylation domain-containing protein
VRGFTLIELLVSIGIIGIVTSIVLVRYGSFDSTTILKNAAYDVALALRESQVRSISVVRGSDASFDSAYGISLSTDTDTYTAFRYASSTGHPRYEGADAELIDVLELPGRAVRIVDICTQKGDADKQTCGLTRLDISFRRPEFNALVSATDSGDAPIPNPEEITDTQIFLASEQNTEDRFVVKVTQFGQISVCKADVPNCL